MFLATSKKGDQWKKKRAIFVRYYDMASKTDTPITILVFMKRFAYKGAVKSTKCIMLNHISRKKVYESDCNLQGYDIEHVGIRLPPAPIIII